MNNKTHLQPYSATTTRLLALFAALIIPLSLSTQVKRAFAADAASSTASTSSGKTVSITGAGATFPYPIYSKWFDAFHKAHPEIEINYNSIGSGSGINNFIKRTIDFGASDAPMTDQEITKAQDPVVHIPTVLGAVVLAYHLPELKNSNKILRLTPQLIADIYQMKIKKWNDPQIQAQNKDVSLPNQDINVVYRSDSSGTTAVFTDFLAKVSSNWKTSVGAGKVVKWPTGIGAKGNEGVTSYIKMKPGSIGYIEYTYGHAQKLDMAEIQNKSGEFIAPSVASITAAAEAMSKSMPADYRISITDPEGKKSYPISSFTYLLLYKNLDAEKGPALIKFLNWAMQEGQQIAPQHDYSPLPTNLVKSVKETIKQLQATSSP